MRVFLIVGVILLFATRYIHCQEVPAEVKAAMAAALKASNTDGMHEEGGIWGRDTNDKLLVIPAKPGLPHDVCTPGIVGISPGDAASPSLDQNLKTIDGEFHVHPSGTKMCNHNSLGYFVQPPSDIDIENALDDINLVIGAGDHFVYFYSTKGVEKKISYREFIR
jgi:hypothetical protein